MSRHRSPLPLVLVLALALAVGWGVSWQWRDSSAKASNSEKFSEPVGDPGKLPKSDGPLSGAPLFEQAPAEASPGDAQTSQQMQMLAARMSRETEDLVVVTHPDGRRSVSLEGKFLHMSAMVTGADGKPQVRCFADFRELTAALPGGQPADRPPPLIHER